MKAVNLSRKFIKNDSFSVCLFLFKYQKYGCTIDQAGGYRKMNRFSGRDAEFYVGHVVLKVLSPSFAA